MWRLAGVLRCSRNARPQKSLVRRAQFDAPQPLLCEGGELAQHQEIFEHPAGMQFQDCQALPGQIFPETTPNRQTCRWEEVS